jgi:hypothetical protein
MVHLDENWGKLTALQQKYGDKVIISDPGRVGAVLVSPQNASWTLIPKL